jgi:hypothetical protein
VVSVREPLNWYDDKADNLPWIKALAEVRRLLCPLVWLIGFDRAGLTMRFGDARGGQCNTGQVLGRAAAYLVNDQRESRWWLGCGMLRFRS